MDNRKGKQMPKSMKISDLPIASQNGEISVAASENKSVRVTINGIADMVKRSLGYLEKPLVKCKHCGQWGAVYCACRYCGAPIDG